MMQSDFVVSLRDLRYVELHCSNCTTIVTLDMEEPSEFSKKHDVFAPKECPGCRKDYDTATRRAVDFFKEGYGHLLQIPKSVTFRGASSRVGDDRA